MEDSYSKIFKDKERVMVVMAHPDDLEVFAGGTVARLIADGKRVISVKVTTGNRGSGGSDISSSELEKVRRAEDDDAMRVLGIESHDSVHLGFNDGEVDNSLEIIGAIVLQIRKFKPELIITTNPEDILLTHPSGRDRVNHRDHRNTALSTVDAAYPYSRDRLFFPEHFEEEGVGPHKVIELLLAGYYDHPRTVAIGVDGFTETRQKALACHKSQISGEGARNATDFFTKHEGADGRFELFRYLITG